MKNYIVITCRCINSFNSRCSDNVFRKDAKKTVGVAMPTKSLQRWIQDGDYMKEYLKIWDIRLNSICRR